MRKQKIKYCLHVSLIYTIYPNHYEPSFCSTAANISVLLDLHKRHLDLSLCQMNPWTQWAQQQLSTSSKSWQDYVSTSTANHCSVKTRQNICLSVQPGTVLSVKNYFDGHISCSSDKTFVKWQIRTTGATYWQTGKQLIDSTVVTKVLS